MQAAERPRSSASEAVRDGSRKAEKGTEPIAPFLADCKSVSSGRPNFPPACIHLKIDELQIAKGSRQAVPFGPSIPGLPVADRAGSAKAANLWERSDCFADFGDRPTVLTR